MSLGHLREGKWEKKKKKEKTGSESHTRRKYVLKTIFQWLQTLVCKAHLGSSSISSQPLLLL